MVYHPPHPTAPNKWGIIVICRRGEVAPTAPWAIILCFVVVNVVAALNVPATTRIYFLGVPWYHRCVLRSVPPLWGRTNPQLLPQNSCDSRRRKL